MTHQLRRRNSYQNNNNNNNQFNCQFQQGFTNGINIDTNEGVVVVGMYKMMSLMDQDAVGVAPNANNNKGDDGGISPTSAYFSYDAENNNNFFDRCSNNLYPNGNYCSTNTTYNSLSYRNNRSNNSSNNNVNNTDIESGTKSKIPASCRSSTSKLLWDVTASICSDVQSNNNGGNMNQTYDTNNCSKSLNKIVPDKMDLMLSSCLLGDIRRENKKLLRKAVSFTTGGDGGKNSVHTRKTYSSFDQSATDDTTIRLHQRTKEAQDVFEPVPSIPCIEMDNNIESEYLLSKHDRRFINENVQQQQQPNDNRYLQDEASRDTRLNRNHNKIESTQLVVDSTTCTTANNCSSTNTIVLKTHDELIQQQQPTTEHVILFRSVKPKDRIVIQQLHEEWFPVRYQDEFYDELVYNRFYHSDAPLYTCMAVIPTKNSKEECCLEQTNKTHNDCTNNIVENLTVPKSETTRSKSIPVNDNQHVNDRDDSMVLAKDDGVDNNENVVNEHSDDNDNNNDTIIGCVVGALFQTNLVSEYTRKMLISNPLIHTQLFYIMTLGTCTLYRNYGLGTLLVNKCLDYAMSNEQCGVVYLHVIVSNVAAIRFYEKLGFYRVSEIKNYYIIDDEHYNCYLYAKYMNGNLGHRSDVRVIIKEILVFLWKYVTEKGFPTVHYFFVTILEFFLSSLTSTRTVLLSSSSSSFSRSFATTVPASMGRNGTIK